MPSALKLTGVVAIMVALAACTDAQQEDIDSAAGELVSDTRANLSVLDIDMGKKTGADQDVSDEIDTFAPTDTIYASVNTTGTVRAGAIKAQWIFPDSSVVDQEAQAPTRDRDANLLFFLTKPEGLAKGKYTFKVLVDGNEVRSEDVTVR